MEKLDWFGLEYEEKEQSPDWFWALGVIVVTSSATAIIYGNYFFAVLLVLSGVLLGFFAKKKPDMVSYELNEKGLKIRDRLYPYENIKSFWVQKAHLEKTNLPGGEIMLKPTLFIKSERFFMPIISVPIEENLANGIRSIMVLKKVEEEEMKDHSSLKIMEYLGF